MVSITRRRPARPALSCRRLETSSAALKASYTPRTSPWPGRCRRSGSKSCPRATGAGETEEIVSCASSCPRRTWRQRKISFRTSLKSFPKDFFDDDYDGFKFVSFCVQKVKKIKSQMSFVEFLVLLWHDSFAECGCLCFFCLGNQILLLAIVNFNNSLAQNRANARTLTLSVHNYSQNNLVYLLLIIN